MMLWKCYTQYASKFGKLRSGHRTEKGQSSFQSQRNKCQRMLKLPHSCTHLTHLQILKILQARLQQYVSCKLPDVQAGFRKGRRTWDQIANICWIIEKARAFQKNIYFSFIDYDKAFDCVDTTNCGKFFKRWEYQTTWPDCWDICMQVKKQQLELNMELQTGSKSGTSRLYIVTLLI